MRTWIVASALASAALAPLSAQEVPPPLTVAQFMERWNEVAKLKEMARVSPEMRRIIEEIGGGLKAYKSQIDADAQAGKPPRACPVKGTKATVTSAEILADPAGAARHAVPRGALRDARQALSVWLRPGMDRIPSGGQSRSSPGGGGGGTGTDPS